MPLFEIKVTGVGSTIDRNGRSVEAIGRDFVSFLSRQGVSVAKATLDVDGETWDLGKKPDPVTDPHAGQAPQVAPEKSKVVADKHPAKPEQK